MRYSKIVRFGSWIIWVFSIIHDVVKQMKEDVYFVDDPASLNKKLSNIEVDRNQEFFPDCNSLIYLQFHGD